MRFFPDGFLWGSATSSYQIEGGWDADGKGASVWDAFCREPGRVVNGDSGDVACDHYHRWRDDVALMAEMGLKVYRFSISWPRILPQGRGAVNEAGVRFYSDLIDELIAHDIIPWVTLYHWDLPLALEEELGGWLHADLAEIFSEYARVCFDRLGDRVKHWATFNEPWCAAMLSYGNGMLAPGHVSNTEPYVVAHNLLRAHGKTVALYRQKFQLEQNGCIGITNNGEWREPLTASPEDQAAAQRSIEFFLGWFADPVYFGDYPAVMRERLGDRLPVFTDEERAQLKGSSDYFGLNHYSTLFAAEPSGVDASAVAGNGGASADQGVTLSADESWKKTAMGWNVVPWGCKKLLQWIDERYEHPEIYITENGSAWEDEIHDGIVNDTDRIEFMQDYLLACHEAIENGVRLKGYFAWSLLDNFEWAQGFGKRFGLIYVDYETQERTTKSSAKWYRNLMDQNAL